MERIMIIGCGGAGKSTLARKMGEKTGLPVVHLDQIFWAPGSWKHVGKEEFDAILMEKMEKPRWIIDGNYNRTISQRIARCDTIIYLDFSRFACMRSWIGRVLKKWGTSRADMGPDCKEWFDPEMAGWIWKFNKTHREDYYRLMNEAEGKETIVLKNRRAVKQFLKNL